MLRKLYTLVLVRRGGGAGGGEVLLGLKKRGFGAGKWNGFGGKLEAGEGWRRGAARELREESGLRAREAALAQLGHLEFTFEGEPVLMEVRVFSVRRFTGVPVETEEMRPRWYSVDELPFDSMWLDDAIWFPYLLDDKPFFGSFHYKGHDEIIKYDLKLLDSMEKFYASCE